MSSSTDQSPLASGRPTSSLNRRLVLVNAALGAIAVLLLALGADYAVRQVAQRDGDVRVADAARRAQLVIDQALEERVREASVVASSPNVIGAARDGIVRSRALGLPGQSIAALESRFAGERSLGVSPATRAYLRALLPQLGAAEMLLTDANGYNAVTTTRSSDFVQRDEKWWESAWRDGVTTADAAYDSSARQTVVSLATVVKDGAVPVGVLKLAFSVAPLSDALALAGAGARVDLLDASDRILLSTDSAASGGTARDFGPAGSGEAVTVTPGGAAERAVVLPSNSGRWRVVAHLPESALAAPYRRVRLGILGASLLLLVLSAALLTAMHRLLDRRIFGPAASLAQAAERVAGGDFSVTLEHSAQDDEIGQLSRALGAMIVELRRLASAIGTSAGETTAMSSEITAGSEEMAATAGEIANTASDLSAQATTMAETITMLATAAGSLRTVATELDAGGAEGVQRNQALRALAMENRVGLDESTIALRNLGDEVNASAMAIEALGDASEEIRSFVVLVRKLARQSKLLALNAAMEAARAGEHGEGFAVVASEVRRLAAMSSDAAERTESIVNIVLAGVEQSRESAGSAVSTAEGVQAATARASASFAEIERAVADAEQWTGTVAETSAAARNLASQMTERLDELAGGTDTFAAAMQQVAASSQEQSASTEEIAAAAATLASAADRLSRLVAGLKVEGGHAPATGEYRGSADVRPPLMAVPAMA